MNRIDQVMDVNEVSRIAQGVVVSGDISSNSDIRFDGSVSGTVYSKGRIVVGETAVLKGVVLCSETDFWGTLEGDIYVKDTLSIKSSAVINGNIHVRKLQVEMGAQINGTCKMITEEEFKKACASAVKVVVPEDRQNPSSKKLFGSSESSD